MNAPNKDPPPRWKPATDETAGADPDANQREVLVAQVSGKETTPSTDANFGRSLAARVRNIYKGTPFTGNRPAPDFNFYSLDLSSRLKGNKLTYLDIF